MDALLSIFWGLVIFSFLVFIHEGGHYLAARMFGARVLEFFIGMPSKRQLSFVSKKNGTRFGITALLFGGYARIAGMDMGKPNPHLALALSLVNARGEISIKDAAHMMDVSVDEAAAALFNLESYGSIQLKPFSDPDLDQENTVYQSMARDEDANTIFDKGAKLNANKATRAGEPFFSKLSGDEFLALERKKTYVGLSIPKRIIVLLAGIIVNLLFAYAVFVAVFMSQGLTVAENTVKDIAPDSIALEQGIESGDTITEIGGTQITSGNDVLMALQSHRGKGSFEVSFTKKDTGEEKAFSTELAAGENLGIMLESHQEKLGFADASNYALKNMVLTAKAIANLLNPQGFMDTVSNSSSVVGVAVLAKDAAQAGIWPLLTLAAAISLSLGLMNLLPIPPLDGGKVVIEIIQAISGKPVSQKVQVFVSMVGIALFMLLFFFLVGQDIFRLLPR